MPDEKAAVDAAAVARALRTAQLLTQSRRVQTGLSVQDAQNLARVTLALNLVATASVDLLQALGADDGGGSDEAAAAYDDRLATASASVAGILHTLGFVHFDEEPHGQEG